MSAIAIWFHSLISPVPSARAARRCAMAATLAVALAASTDARAGTEGTTSVQSDALTQMALDALSQGVVAPGAWEPRAALIGLGVAGLYLGISNAPSARSRPRDAVRSAAYRLALPLGGAALGSLLACRRLCDGQAAAPEPLIGATAGALAAHVLDLGTSPGRGDRGAGAATPKIDWTPVVALAPGSYSLGIAGRF
jgi:hypothetical protein